MTPDEIIEIIRRHILPWCNRRDGKLPGEELFHATLTRGDEFVEWTIDAFGMRDWKVDQSSRGTVRIRYRGDDPKARAAAEACNEELAR